jgi:hypothetical protein
MCRLRQSHVAIVLTWIALSAPGATSTQAVDVAEEKPEFQKHVLPILEAKCMRCHGARRRDGKLDLRTLESIRQGGVSGSAIKPGDATKSLLIELIHYNEMPPLKEQPRVTPAELKLLRTWIEQLPPS